MNYYLLLITCFTKIWAKYRKYAVLENLQFNLEEKIQVLCFLFVFLKIEIYISR